MKRSLLCGAALALCVCALWACSNSDEASPEDEGQANPLACGEETTGPRRALLVQGGASSELAVVNLETKKVDGRLRFDGAYGLTSSVGASPYLLGGESDVVMRLDAAAPWKALATWNVRGTDALSNGDPNANPVAVVPVSCSKAYVLRYNRDRIAIIDPSATGDAEPTGFIDLTSLKDPADPNMLEVTSAVYVPAKKLVYVLLGNIDFTKFVKDDGGKLVCSKMKPSVIAIDVDTDEVVSLGGTGKGGGIELDGYNPPLGVPLAYDAAGERLLVLEGGCNVDAGGKAGAMSRRRIEEVDLGSGKVRTLVSLDDREFPAAFAYVSKTRAAVSFNFDGYVWDPSASKLGAAIPGGMGIIAIDGRGGFVGGRQATTADGGAGDLEVVTLSGSSTPTVVLSNPFSNAAGYLAGVEAWPQR